MPSKLYLMLETHKPGAEGPDTQSWGGRRQRKWKGKEWGVDGTKYIVAMHEQ